LHDSLEVNEYFLKANSHTTAHHLVVKPSEVVSTAMSHTSTQLGLYKIFVYFEAIVHESTILSFPPPTCIAHPGAILLHDNWTV